MTRPSARATPDQLADAARAKRLADGAAARVAELRANRQQLRDDVLDHVTHSTVAVYSVEVAKALGARIATVASVLRTLEAEGLLLSEFRPAVRSGLGRRYYWRAK